MGSIEDFRQIFQDIIAPDLKSISQRLAHLEQGAEQRDRKLDRIESSLADLRVLFGQLITSLELDKRVARLEQRTEAQKHETQ